MTGPLCSSCIAPLSAAYIATNMSSSSNLQLITADLQAQSTACRAACRASLVP